MVVYKIVIGLFFGASILWGHDTPYSLKKFQPILDKAKLQAPVSSYDPLYSRHYGDFAHYQNRYFYLQDDAYMVFYMCGKKRRSELRFKHDWKVSTRKPIIMEAEVKLFPLNAKREFTFLQIHADSTLKEQPTINKPLLRIVWKKVYRHQKGHLWAILRQSANVGEQLYQKIDLGKMSKDFFTVKIVVQNSVLTIYLNGQKSLETDVDYWNPYFNYFKAGVYLQDEGCAKALFKKLIVKGK